LKKGTFVSSENKGTVNKIPKRKVASSSLVARSKFQAASLLESNVCTLAGNSPIPNCGEIVVKINGRIRYLWRAVDQDGDVLDILVQSRRDRKAAKKFFRKLLKGLRYVPRVIIIDKLKSYGAAKAEVPLAVEHCGDKGQNNRAENSHQPTRLRKRVMRRFKVIGPCAAFSLGLWNH